MNKKVCLCSCLVAVMFAGSSYAQLPANPWDTSQSTGGVAKISREVSNEAYIQPLKYNPVNADNTVKYVPAIDAQGNAKTGVEVKKISSVNTSAATTDNTVTSTTDNTETKKVGNSVALNQNIKNNGTSWRGSGQFGKLNYTGEVTTYGTAYGQEMLAPEVNQHNIRVMLDHLRSLGYKIPESYNNKFNNFLSDYKAELRTAYDGLGHQNNPFDTMFSGILDVVEEGTGLDMENLLFNSFDLMSRD